MIFPQTVNCWGSQCHLRPGSLGVGWWPSWRTRRQTRKTRAQAPDMWSETRARTTFNGSQRSVERKRSSKSGAQHEEHLPNTAPRRAALDQVQINKAVVPQWPPRSQGQTQTRRSHSHEGGHGSKTWWQKNARRLERMRDCHRKLLLQRRWRRTQEFLPMF